MPGYCFFIIIMLYFIIMALGGMRMSSVGKIEKKTDTPFLNFYEFEAFHRDGSISKYPYYVASRAKKVEDL